MSTLREIIVTTKNHLDVGFTENEGKVLHDAIWWMLPLAATQARRMRETGDDGMCWLVPAFIAELALEWLEGDALRTVEDGFAAGDLAWHALPFTTHTELLDEGLLDASTQVARRLDTRFGRRTTCAKLTDVPGHTIALVGALARAGITSLHIGNNWMSPSPDVPPLARWRDPDGNEVVLAINPNGYGGMVHLPGDDRALLWDVTGDNMEVPSPADQHETMARLRAAHPGARVRAGRPEDWAGEDLAQRAALLPVIDADLGDSWIHGTGSDPWKTARLRELMRLRRDWLAAHRLLPGSRTSVLFDRELLLVAEHTWGGNVSAWTHHDRTHHDNERFARIRNQGAWRCLAASWQEQRDHIDRAIAVLDDANLRTQAQAACDACDPRPIDRSAWDACDPSATHRFGSCAVRIDHRGAITSIQDAGERLAGPTGLVRYQTFDAGDCRRAIAEYSHVPEQMPFARVGLESSNAISRWWEPTLVACWRRGDRLALDLAFPEAAITGAGAPRRITVTWQVAPGSICGQLAWFDKHPTRLPEALWWSFDPVVPTPDGWRFDKSGRWIDPLRVPRRGGRWLHGVQSGARNGPVSFTTRTAHLLALGRPMLYRFPDEPLDPRGGLHLNLMNNCWDTNFPLWCGDDLAFDVGMSWAADVGAQP